MSRFSFDTTAEDAEWIRRGRATVRSFPTKEGAEKFSDGISAHGIPSRVNDWVHSGVRRWVVCVDPALLCLALQIAQRERL